MLHLSNARRRQPGMDQPGRFAVGPQRSEDATTNRRGRGGEADLEGVGKLLTGFALAPDMTQAPGPVGWQDLPRLASSTTAMVRRWFLPTARQDPCHGRDPGHMPSCAPR